MARVTKQGLRQRFGRLRRRMLLSIAGAPAPLHAGQVALTYDDGPHPEFTPLILDILHAHGISASFFLVGERAAQYPKLVQRIADEGHAIGSHSMRHPDFASTSVSDVTKDVRESIHLLESLVGRPIKLLRPPHGHLTLGSAIAMRRLGLRVALWDVNSGDWKSDATPSTIAAQVLEAQPPSVVLLHDTLQRAVDATAMIAQNSARREFVVLHPRAT